MLDLSLYCLTCFLILLLNLVAAFCQSPQLSSNGGIIINWIEEKIDQWTLIMDNPQGGQFLKSNLFNPNWVDPRVIVVNLKKGKLHISGMEHVQREQYNSNSGSLCLKESPSSHSQRGSVVWGLYPQHTALWCRELDNPSTIMSLSWEHSTAKTYLSLWINLGEGESG